jgi:T-complex protein 1 subunit zeta
MIGRAATAQDDIVGDGTTSNVLFIGELLRQAERYLGEGVHPRILVDGIELAKRETLAFLEVIKIQKPDV